MTKKLIAYLRVSTEDRKSGQDEEEALRLGIEAQRSAIRQFAEQSGYQIIEEVEERASGKLGYEDRPVLHNAVIKAAKLGATVVVSKLDRLSRDVEFVAGFIKRVKFIAVALGEDVEPMLIHLYATFAEKERNMISDRTTAALISLKEQGVELGYANHKDPNTIIVARAKGAASNAAKADEFAGKMKTIIGLFIGKGMSYRQIAAELNAQGIKTARGGAWYSTTISNMVNRWAAEDDEVALNQ